MTEYWKSQPRKFCDVCKCWIADNKVSVQFHENGSRHQAQVRKRLDEIRRKGSASDRQAREELQILQKMEAAAMADYMGKDVAGAHNDLTSKVFADKKKERDKEKADIEAKAKEAMEKAAASAAAPPGPSSTPESSSDGSRSIGPVMLNPIAAPKQGTKWHKPEAKKWFEAVTEDGHTYFWHVETHQSRWTAPEEGYFSIAEQEETNRKHEEKEEKRIAAMYQSQSVHGTSEVKAAEVEVERARNPYGRWQTVTCSGSKASKSGSAATTTDLETPLVREKVGSGVTLHKDADMKGVKIKTAPTSATAEFSGPIAFKKRKLAGDHRKNMRRRDNNDD